MRDVCALVVVVEREEEEKEREELIRESWREQSLEELTFTQMRIK